MSSSDVKCKNCGNSVEANYCSHCGQSAKTERIDLLYLFQSLIYGMFHVDKGILHTIKILTLHPGKAIRGYLSGKRASLFKPFSYLITLAAIYVLCFLAFDLNSYHSNAYSAQNAEIDALGSTIATWITNHLGIVQLMILPISAFFSFLLFKKSNYNYGENLVINIYVSAHVILFSILLLPVVYLLSKIGYEELSFYLSSVLSTIVEMIMLCSVFTMYSKTSRVIRSFIWAVLSNIAFIFIISIVIFFSYYLA
jgi:Protein of unknown function (DUF3667).